MCRESWAHKNWCFWTVVFEKTLESPLDCKEIQPVHLKGNQSWVFFGRTDAEAETPILWPPDVKSWLIWKDPDVRKDWGQEEKWTTEDEMVGWHHRLNGHEFGWTSEVGDGQGGLACCGSWGRKGSDTTEWPTWTETLLLTNLHTEFKTLLVAHASSPWFKKKKKKKTAKFFDYTSSSVFHQFNHYALHICTYIYIYTHTHKHTHILHFIY